MGKKYLIDSNTIIEFHMGKLPEKGYAFVAKIIDESFDISVINKIEVLGHHSVTQKTRKFISLANVYELNDKVVNKTIELRKKYRIKLPDAIIAATALLNKLTLISHNISDFKNINGLKLLDPWEVL